jgi:CRISPR/Cas system-associated exonuclease Cas4 (RecB family)
MGKLENQFSWSLSRESIFQSCRRKYWLNYYGSWEGWGANATPLSRAAYVLKQLKTRQIWAGTIVHETLENILKAWRRGRQPLQSDVIEATVEQMRMEYRSSRYRNYVTAPKTCALFEHHYGVEVEDIQWIRNRQHVIRCLDSFFESNWAVQLQQLTADKWLEIESFSSFFVGGIKVFVRPDVAYRTDNGIQVIDWKTGRSTGDDNDIKEKLQLTLYALYATERWGVSLSDITSSAVNLHFGDAREYDVDEEAAAAMRVRVTESARAMAEMLVDRNPEKNEAVMADFPMTDDTGSCKKCIFKELCWGDAWASL